MLQWVSMRIYIQYLKLFMSGADFYNVFFPFTGTFRRLFYKHAEMGAAKLPGF
jgi:hypothetical protein